MKPRLYMLAPHDGVEEFLPEVKGGKVVQRMGQGHQDRGLHPDVAGSLLGKFRAQ